MTSEGGHNADCSRWSHRGLQALRLLQLVHWVGVKGRTCPQALMTAADGHIGLESWPPHQSATPADCSRWSQRAGVIARTSPQALQAAVGPPLLTWLRYIASSRGLGFQASEVVKELA